MACRLLGGRITAAVSAPAIWIPQSAKTYPMCGNKAPSIPNKKAGPALLQKPSSREASSLEILPDRKAAAAACAPAGYPPRNPAIRMHSVPLGMEHIFRTGFIKTAEEPRKACVNKFVRRKKGNRDGTTQFRQNVMPRCIPWMAVCPSRISTRIPAAEKNPLHIFFLIRSITSEDSMQNQF